MLKKLLIISTTIITLISIIFVNKYIFINKSDEDTKNSITKKYQNELSMMLETASGSGEYEKTTASEWPTEGYVFNSELSKCENGGELSWDDTKKNITMSGNMSDKCYVYFDVAPYYLKIGTKLTFNSSSYPNTSNYILVGDLQTGNYGEGHFTNFELTDTSFILNETYYNEATPVGVSLPVLKGASYIYLNNYYVFYTESSSDTYYYNYKFSKEGYQNICINAYKKEIVDCNNEKWMYTGYETGS